MEKETKTSRYEQFPCIAVKTGETAAQGFAEICDRLRPRCQGRTIVAAECYPGVDQAELLTGLSPLNFALVIHADALALPPEEIDRRLEADLTEDPVFGCMTARNLIDFFDAEKLRAASAQAAAQETGPVLIYGVGATLVHPGDVTLLCDITRWEIQLRYRRGMDNWRTAKRNLSNREKFKRGYFAEWRWADRIKDDILPTLDYYLDMTAEGAAAMVSGEAYRSALEQVARQPFRMAPYFDPGVWGGDWMKTHFALPENGSNYAWSFDGVPEENSLLLDFGGARVRTPAMNLVLFRPRQLLGERVHARFGKEFPIRFDLLDTVHGQNLSLQVHPLTEYIQRHFNMRYTQDESYYILDAEGEDPCVYLGIKTGTKPEEMAQALRTAQRGEELFPAEEYVNRIPVKKHDHLLIPGGTVHCSGANTMVLEISATPYIFTFKLWDWGRVDLDGKPRPIHLDHGLANIQWERDTQWVQENLVNRVTTVYESDGCHIERTGLHEREFIDTFRICTADRVPIRRNGSVHVINLVEGSQVRLESPTNAFPPFTVHYAETCIIPQAAGDYTIAADGEEGKVILACVRD